MNEFLYTKIRFNEIEAKYVKRDKKINKDYRIKMFFLELRFLVIALLIIGLILFIPNFIFGSSLLGRALDKMYYMTMSFLISSFSYELWNQSKKILKNKTGKSLIIAKTINGISFLSSLSFILLALFFIYDISKSVIFWVGKIF